MRTGAKLPTKCLKSTSFVHTRTLCVSIMQISSLGDVKAQSRYVLSVFHFCHLLTITNASVARYKTKSSTWDERLKFLDAWWSDLGTNSENYKIDRHHWCFKTGIIWNRYRNTVIQIYVSNPLIHTWTMLSFLDTFVGCHTKKENVIFIIFKQIEQTPN